jgi:DNA-directed RNA polymerase subunit RPC12/RpoP
MSISFTCTGCGATFEVADSRAGQRGTCPKCQTRTTVPGHPPVWMDLDPLSFDDEQMQAAPPPVPAWPAPRPKVVPQVIEARSWSPFEWGIGIGCGLGLAVLLLVVALAMLMFFLGSHP